MAMKKIIEIMIARVIWVHPRENTLNVYSKKGLGQLIYIALIRLCD